MKPFPTDPMRQHNIHVAALCDDLWDMWVNGGKGTPKADRVAEIARQTNKALSNTVKEANDGRG